jgi:hypothetical protein
MTPQEKAKELVREFKKYAYYPKTKDDEIFVDKLKTNAKQCALIAVDEILDVDCCDMSEAYFYNHIEYWQEVKQEIEKL